MKNLKHIHVFERYSLIEASVVIVDVYNNILFLKRNSKSFYDQWGLPGGKSDFGEEKNDTAIRELFEETGIISDKRDLTYLGEKESATGFVVNVFHLKLNRKPNVSLSNEHTDYIWTNNYRNLNLAGNTKDFLELIF